MCKVVFSILWRKRKGQTPCGKHWETQKKKRIQPQRRKATSLLVSLTYLQRLN
uniref:Uncharacterized protein n=1 Tax=Anguilla anguilla TaxID=7936 RepID=A0A0E9UX82_ANGAN